MRYAVKRYATIISIIALALGLWWSMGTSASADSDTGSLVVTVTPEQLSTSVGQPASVTITLANESAEPTGDLAVHIDITDPRGTNSVDPEDWTPELTLFREALLPGEQVTESWTVTPIQGGDFVLYAVAINANGGIEAGMLSVSNGVPIHVEEKRSFNPQGVLPLSVAMPTLLGVALVWRFRRVRLK